MVEFYDKLLTLKKYYKLNNNVLGAVVGMKGDTFRNAVTKMTLSGLEIKELEGYFESLEKTINSDTSGEKKIIDLSPAKGSGRNIDVNAMVDYIIDNSEQLRKTVPKFQLFCRMLEVDAQKEALLEEIIRLRSSSIKA